VNRSSLTSALFLLVAIAALAAVLLWPEPGTEAAEQGGGMGDFRFPVTAALVGDGAVVESAELVGDVVSARRSTLAFDRNGTLLSVVVRMGDRVTKGQLLAELDDRVLAQDLASAQAAAEVAAEETKYAEREAQRAREVGDDVVSDSERERLQSDAAVTARRLVQRLSEAARLQAQLDKGKLRAPFSGVIARRMLDEGAQAGPSAPVIDLVDPDHREIRLEVPAPLVGSLGVGSPVVLSLDERPEWSLEVALDALVPAADPGSRSFIAIVRIDEISSDAGENPNAVLLPGLFVRARLTLREVSGQPVVPIDALLESPRGFAVYAVAPPEAAAEAGQAPAAPTAKLVQLRILARNASHAAVAPFEPSALAPGSRVVVTGVQNIFPGAPLGLAQGQ
jgi:RND family efflux transporter MFP subunit